MTTGRKTKTAKSTKPGKRPRRPTFGGELIAAIESLGDPAELARAVITGKVPPGANYRMTRLTVSAPTFPAPALTPKDVADTRSSLGLGQAAFAAFLGVTPAVVRAWEEGRAAVPRTASRFLAEVRSDPGYWQARVAAAAG